LLKKDFILGDEIVKRNKATTAKVTRNKLKSKVYPQSTQLSDLKILIGELLLFENQQTKEFWQYFEELLTQYLENNNERLNKTNK
jgi:23S rRNA maturation mini-RNase III